MPMGVAWSRLAPSSSSSTANSPTASSRGFANPTTRSPESRNAFASRRHSRSEASRSQAQLGLSSRDLGWRSHRARRGSRRRRPAAFAGVWPQPPLIVGLLLGVRIDLAGNPAGADTTVVTTVPAPVVPETRPAHRRSRRQPPAQASRKAQATAPALRLGTRSGCVGVPRRAFPRLVEGVRDGHGARRADHPAALDVRGRTRHLAPGEYRWYVWPVTSGRRAARAIVQARLTIPSS